MECRVGCAACCVVISISSPIPGMPEGKPAGVPCIHLTADRRCALFGHPGRPEICSAFTPSEEHCGRTNDEAFRLLEALEKATHPGAGEGGPRTRQHHGTERTQYDQTRHT